MITDYSSCIFDFALTWKPSIIYASDIKEYKKDRNFEIKLEDTPFPIAKDNKDLKRIIETFDIISYRKEVKDFYNSMWLNETWESCKRIVEIINEVTK